MNLAATEWPSAKARRRWIIGAGVLLALAGMLVVLQVNPWDIVTQVHFLADLAR